MDKNVWNDLHRTYKNQEWINKASIFAEQALDYFPAKGKVLDLGAGQAQDSCYFAERGYNVTATDIEDSALELAEKKALSKSVDIKIQKIDLIEKLPFQTNSFDVVYSHLALHYFDHETTTNIFNEIYRVLKPGGTLALLVNSVNDPQYKTGEMIEDDYFQIGKSTKRYFSKDTINDFTQRFSIVVADEHGETYKDSAAGIHNLVRFIGKKPLIEKGL